jgi:carbon monoxide dehydrogenase subunit G
MADVVTVERVVPAEPQAIFDLLADPARHHEIDGSGTLVGAKGGGGKLGLGDTFGMAMKVGIPYSMVSTIVEYEEGRRIAWQTRGPGRIGTIGGGRIWRYELEPVDGGTLVKESWDITQESKLTKPLVKGLGEKTRKNMAETLDRLAARFSD